MHCTAYSRSSGPAGRAPCRFFMPAPHLEDAMPPRKVPPEPDPEPELAEPPYYEAAEDLYVWHPDAAAMPALAYRAGDPVVPGVIAANRWHGKVRVPDRFAGQLG